MKTVSGREDFLREVSNYMPKTIVAIELGVLKGEFSQSILDILNPFVLCLVDPFEVNEQKYNDGLTTSYSTQNDFDSVKDKFNEQINKKRLFLDRQYSYDAVKDYEDKCFEFIYIDASHLYEDVKKDLNDWLPKLTKDGLMCGHDYFDFNGFGVVKAVNEFCKEHNFEMIIFNENGYDWALKRK